MINFLIENANYFLASILFFIGYWAKGNMDFSAKDGFTGKNYYKNKSASWGDQRMDLQVKITIKTSLRAGGINTSFH